MKKIFLLMVTAAIMMVGCGSENTKKEEKVPMPPQVSEIETPPMPDGFNK